jgi:hypothetical protein
MRILSAIKTLFNRGPVGRPVNKNLEHQAPERHRLPADPELPLGLFGPSRPSGGWTKAFRSIRKGQQPKRSFPRSRPLVGTVRHGQKKVRAEQRRIRRASMS